MEHESAADAAMEVARWFAEHGTAAFVIFHDKAGWHLVGQPYPGPTLAAAFRSLADQCEEQLAPEVVN